MNNEFPLPDSHPLSDYVRLSGERNRDSILATFKNRLTGEACDVLEYASGSGMHINYFATHFPSVRFHPSDNDEETFDCIKDLRRKGENENVQDPVLLDLKVRDTWPARDVRRFAAIFCINLIHVAPVEAMRGVMECSAQLLAPDGFLLIYGPFMVDGKYTTTSNEEFDKVLRSAGGSEWGLKDVSDLTSAAAEFGLAFNDRLEMPGNNFTLIYGDHDRGGRYETGTR